MAKTVITLGVVYVNGVDLSDHCSKVELTYEAEAPESTSFGSTTKRRLVGLKDWSLSIEFSNDWAGSSVDATLFPLVGAAAFPIRVRANSGAIATTNPEYQGNGILTSYPIALEQGAEAKTTVTIMGDDTLTRDVTP